jgi:two-component system, cell cycle sensor histidine kinase and response regulator CckA
MAGIHVLLVDDHALLRDLMMRILASNGFQVTAAESGEAAIQLLEDGLSPQVLLSDIRMPGRYNGVELARWARKRYPSLVILLQTAFTDIDTGDFRVLHKPFDPQLLLSAIQELTGVAGTAAPEKDQDA